MAILSAGELSERLAATPRLSTRVVSAAEIAEGAELLVQRLTGRARVALESAFAAVSEGAKPRVMEDAVIITISECVLDERGHRVMPEHQAKQLFQKFPEVAFRVRDTAMELAGMTDDEVADLAQDFG